MWLLRSVQLDGLQLSNSSACVWYTENLLCAIVSDEGESGLSCTTVRIKITSTNAATTYT